MGKSGRSHVKVVLHDEQRTKIWRALQEWRAQSLDWTPELEQTFAEVVHDACVDAVQGVEQRAIEKHSASMLEGVQEAVTEAMTDARVAGMGQGVSKAAQLLDKVYGNKGWILVKEGVRLLNQLAIDLQTEGREDGGDRVNGKDLS